MLLLGLALIFMVQAVAAASSTPDSYTRVISGRAAKIVETLGIEDAAKAERVQAIIMDQYRALRDIHDGRDAAVKAIKDGVSDSAIAEAAIAEVEESAELIQYRQHFKFLAQLATELSNDQIEGVKNGLTYGVVPITFQGYQDLLPQMTDEQRRFILAALVEAREHAMDGGSSDEKHHIFGKYKGRINNYLAAAGIDMKQAERELAERRKQLK